MCDTASQGLRKRVGPARQASSFTEMDAFKSKKKLMVFLGIINQKRPPPPPPHLIIKPGLFALQSVTRYMIDIPQGPQQH